MREGRDIFFNIQSEREREIQREKKYIDTKQKRDTEREKIVIKKVLPKGNPFLSAAPPWRGRRRRRWRRCR